MPYSIQVIGIVTMIVGVFALIEAFATVIQYVFGAGKLGLMIFFCTILLTVAILCGSLIINN